MTGIVLAGLAGIGFMCIGHLILKKCSPLDILGGAFCGLVVLAVIVATLSYLGAV